MANTVVVTVTRDADSLIFEVGDGAEDVRKLPGFKDTRFKIKVADLSTGPDSKETMLAACRQLGGDQWRADLNWQLIDERGNGIDEFQAFSERGGTLSA